MLGWELPPYNSGGLGTACLGMTEGLANRAVNITFLVPKLFGKLPYDHMNVLSATDYTGDDALSQLLQREDIQQELITHQLAYGARATVSLDEQKQILIEHLRHKLPISANIQASWYAQQSAQVAEANPNFEVIHAHDWMTYYGGMAARDVAAKHGRKVPFIAHVHATEIDRCGEYGDPEIVAIERKGLAAADHVIAVSHFTKELLHKRYAIPREKISVVHNGIPKHRAPAKFSLHEMKKHHKIVVFMGRVTMQKGPDYYVKLAKAVTDIDPSVRFVLAGSGDMEKRCIEDAARSGLTGKMLFSSFLRGKDVDKAYQLADLFVMPSVSEPFGIVALEAMQNNTPVLVSNQSGVAEVSNNILKADFWDIPAMRDHVLNILANPDYAAELTAKAKVDLEQLTWDHAAVKLHMVYEQVLEQLKGAPLPILQPALVTA